jgi:DNA repair exonuclease SbcCD ATPase subunit
MDSQSLPVLIAVASLVTGILLCWLVMRGHVSAAAAQGKTNVQAELALAQAHSRTREEEHQRAVADYEALNRQASQWREALDLARQEQTKLAEQTSQLPILEARLLALEDENTALKHDVASMSTSLQEQKMRPAAQPAPVTQATQLPVLEEEVIALQTLAKTIQQEFQLMAELQRIFTLTSTTIQESCDSPTPHEDASIAT